MIRIEFYQSDNMITGFECKGHSGTAESGSDIVCAFVSSACYLAANTVTEIMSLNAEAQATEGFMRLSIKESPIKAQDIMKGLLLHFTELEKQYPDNIKVSTMEV